MNSEDKAFSPLKSCLGKTTTKGSHLMIREHTDTHTLYLGMHQPE